MAVDINTIILVAILVVLVYLVILVNMTLVKICNGSVNVGSKGAVANSDPYSDAWEGSPIITNNRKETVR